MNEVDIDNLCSDDHNLIESILKGFLKKNESEFFFPSLSANGLRAQLWSSLFQHLDTPSSKSIHSLCLACLKILSRDCDDLENLICEKWINTLVEKAGLYEVAVKDRETLANIKVTNQDKDVVLEAVKCLCNLVYNSPENCVQGCLVEGLMARFQLHHNLLYGDEIAMFDTKLLFLLTATRSDVKDRVKREFDGTKYLLKYIDEILKEVEPVQHQDITNYQNFSMEYDKLIDIAHHYLLTDTQQAILCDILKTLYILIPSSPSSPDSASTEESDSETFVRLIPLLRTLLTCGCSTRDKQLQLQSHISNMLTSVPDIFFPELTPPLAMSGPTPPAHCRLYDCNMEPLYILILLLQYKLSSQKDVASQHENLSPILTVMVRASRAYRLHRKLLRSVVLPPLKDVSQPPEQGDSLRNQLCRLITSPVSQVMLLSGELLLTLCRGKVDRLVKYVGYGNAAGFLAAKGLLGGGKCGDHASSSEDSDTEGYQEASVDVVTGCEQTLHADPFEGYTEEQKEYEAMKLVGLLDKLSASGVVQPATVGEDGRLKAVEHLLEMRDGQAKKP